MHLPGGGPLWSGRTLWGGGSRGICAVEDFRGGRSERSGLWQGCGRVGRCGRSSTRLGGGGGACACRRRGLRCSGFSGGGLPPALQGVEGNPAGLRFRLRSGGALLLLGTGDRGGVLGRASLGRRRLGRVQRLTPWRRRPWCFLTLLLHTIVWGKDLQDRGLLQRSPQLPGREGQEGAVAVGGGHSEKGAITRPGEKK